MHTCATVTRSCACVGQMVAQLAKAQGAREKGVNDDEPTQGWLVGAEFVSAAEHAQSTFSHRRSREVLSAAQTQPHSVSGAGLSANIPSWEGRACEVQGEVDRSAGQSEIELVVGDMVMPIVGEA